MRSKILSGKVYTEIPQRGLSKLADETEPERQKLLECIPSSSGIIKPIYLHRNNSIQENTIEEEVDEQYKVVPAEKEVTMADIHNIPCDSCRNKNEIIQETPENKLPLPPNEKEQHESTDERQFDNGKKEIENTTSKQLIIIEENDEKKDFNISNECCEATDILSKVTSSTQEPILESKPNGFVKNIVNLIEHENSFNTVDEVDESCEHLLDEADTEVVFELPDYVNVTSPPIPPRPTCENIST